MNKNSKKITNKASTSKKGKTEELIYSAFESISQKEAEQFMQLDVSNVEYGKGFYKRPPQTGNRSSAPSWKIYLRTAAVACILLISMLCTACVFIPTLRKAVGQTFIAFYDKYLTVYFDTDEDKAPPYTIEKKATMQYLPSGYYTVPRNSESDLRDMLVFSANGEEMFIFTQFTMYMTNVQYSFEEGDILFKVSVNGHTGTLINYPDIDKYVLVWSNGVYQYSLSGRFSDKDEVLQIANGVKTEK